MMMMMMIVSILAIPKQLDAIWVLVSQRQDIKGQSATCISGTDGTAQTLLMGVIEHVNSQFHSGFIVIKSLLTLEYFTQPKWVHLTPMMHTPPHLAGSANPGLTAGHRLPSLAIKWLLAGLMPDHPNRITRGKKSSANILMARPSLSSLVELYSTRIISYL